MRSVKIVGRAFVFFLAGAIAWACGDSSGNPGDDGSSDGGTQGCNGCDARADSGSDQDADNGGGDGASGSDSGPGNEAGTTSFPAGTICNDTGAVRTRPSVVKHVIVFMFENKDYSDVMGSGSAPYMNSIKGKCGYSTQFLDNVFSSDINSLSHYMAITSGSNCNTGVGKNGSGCITDDNDPDSHQLTTVSIMEQAASYKGYIESMPSACDGNSGGEYATKHNPPPYYTRIAASCAAGDVGLAAVSCPKTAGATCSAPNNALTQDLANDTLAAYSFVTPNLTNDMHDGTVSQGDNWLHTYLPLVLASPAYLRGEVAVYVLWDEQNNFSGGATPNIFVSPYVQPTASNETMNLFSVLRANEAQLGISTYVGCAGGTPPGGSGTCPKGSTADLRAIFNF
jgi:phosphatidylinositol-3-phosphatase